MGRRRARTSPNASTTTFNNSGVGPFSTLIPAVSIDSGIAIPGGMQYGVELSFGDRKVISDLPGGGSAEFGLVNLFATVLDSDPYTLTFKADERLETQSGTDWDFSPFLNAGSTLTISLSIDPTRNFNFHQFLAGTAIDPSGNPVYVHVGDYQFEQVAGNAVPEPATLTLWCTEALRCVLLMRVRRRRNSA